MNTTFISTDRFRLTAKARTELKESFKNPMLAYAAWGIVGRSGYNPKQYAPVSTTKGSTARFPDLQNARCFWDHELESI